MQEKLRNLSGQQGEESMICDKIQPSNLSSALTMIRSNCPNIYDACEYFSHDQSIVWDFLKNNHINHR